MSSLRGSLRARILAVLFQTRRAEVPWGVLLRNTAAAIVPLALGIATGRVGIGLWISVGAIVTMYSDQPGPYRQRLIRLLAVSAAGGFAAFVGLVLGGHLAPLLAATLVISFAGALLVVFGDAAGRVGMAAMILLVITAADPASGPLTALATAALIAGGGLLLTLFSIAAWPLQRYGPEREALAAVYDGLGALARQPVPDSGTAPGLSSGMTELQHTLLGPHRARGAHSPRADGAHERQVRRERFRRQARRGRPRGRVRHERHQPAGAGRSRGAVGRHRPIHRRGSRRRPEDGPLPADAAGRRDGNSPGAGPPRSRP